ncbi:hypothetical protein BGZ65_011282 [Modicella reniformis]|uniref:Uncharacterized protein n=1 Tax=Modicella reniformis TaxID=1440133 RepID=A0A9P6MKJ7_9FUNG|nr:hypothetical protein BGZ65_011282 [Modicella reniformis]
MHITPDIEDSATENLVVEGHMDSPTTISTGIYHPELLQSSSDTTTTKKNKGDSRSYSTPIRRTSKRNRISIGFISSARPRSRSRPGAGRGLLRESSTRGGRVSVSSALLATQSTATSVALSNSSQWTTNHSEKDLINITAPTSTSRKRSDKQLCYPAFAAMVKAAATEPNLDSTLPSPLPIRINTCQNKESPTGSTPICMLPRGMKALNTTTQLSLVTKGLTNADSGPGASPPSATTSTPTTEKTGASNESSPSSTSRFKDMIKRNVGFSSSSSSSTLNLNSNFNSMPSCADPPTVIPSGTVASSSSSRVLDSLLSSSSWPPIGDLSSGDEQRPSSSSSSSLLSLSRLTGRRRKLQKSFLSSDHSQVSGGEEDHGDDDTSPSTVRENTHSFHYRSFPPHLHHYRHHFHHREDRAMTSIVLGTHCAEDQEEQNNQQQQQQILGNSRVSQPLKEARQRNQDLNILLAELEPLPADFVNVFAATIAQKAPPTIGESFTQKQQQQQHLLISTTTTTTTTTTTPTPTLASAPTSPTTMIGLSSNNSGNATGVAASIIAAATVTLALATIKQSNIPQPPFMASSILPSTTTVTSNRNASLLGSRNFLFKSYQNSGFQGHYVFRVREDSVEYARLPVILEEACSQYFREADTMYRELESKSKTWRDEQKAAREKREKAFEELMLNMITKTTDQALTPSPSLVSHEDNNSNNSDHVQNVASSETRHASQQKQDDGHSDHSSQSLNPGTVLKSDSTKYDSAGSMDNNDTSQKTGNSDPSDGSVERPNSCKEMSNNDGHAGSIGRGGSQTVATTVPAVTSVHCSSVCSAATTKAESLTCIAEYEELERMQRAIDNAYWQGVELNHWEASKRSLFGLDLYLQQLIKHVEYELFDKSYNVNVLNKNRDSPSFSIINGDKTNEMWLEAPSVKQKHEFLNWIAISLMNNRESEYRQQQQQQQQQEQQQQAADKNWSTVGNRSSYVDAFLGCDNKNKKRGSYHDTDLDMDVCRQDTDYLLDIVMTRVSSLEAKLTAKREQIQDTMRKIEKVLEKLDDLGERAKARIDESKKKVASSTERKLDTQQIRAALQPSPATGLTLAQIVEAKMRDVNELIVICARDMYAARLNLNRLTYELELERRSVRLFRRYKIVIASVLISIVGLLCYLYFHRRTAAALPTMTELPSATSLSFPMSPTSKTLIYTNVYY